MSELQKLLEECRKARGAAMKKCDTCVMWACTDHEECKWNAQWLAAHGVVCVSDVLKLFKPQMNHLAGILRRREKKGFEDGFTIQVRNQLLELETYYEQIEALTQGSPEAEGSLTWQRDPNDPKVYVAEGSARMHVKEGGAWKCALPNCPECATKPDDGASEDDKPKYPCDDCGMMLSKNQGGTVFTVCDDCWDKHWHGASPERAEEDIQKAGANRPRFVEEVRAALELIQSHAGLALENWKSIAAEETDERAEGESATQYAENFLSAWKARADCGDRAARSVVDAVRGFANAYEKLADDRAARYRRIIEAHLSGFSPLHKTAQAIVKALDAIDREIQGGESGTD